MSDRADYPGAEHVPPLDDDDVTRIAYLHSQPYTTEVRRGEFCAHCRQPFPCETYRLAVEVLGRREVVGHPGLNGGQWE